VPGNFLWFSNQSVENKMVVLEPDPFCAFAQ